MADRPDRMPPARPGSAPSSRTSSTAAGPTEAPLPELIDAINQVFTLFRLNYHNQYYAAWPGDDELRQVKKLWLEGLRAFSPTVILRGARKAIEDSEYLPNLSTMIQCCRDSDRNLPGTREAYLEACRATSPKAAWRWSHPAVYHAGRATGWRTLAAETEAFSYPLFREQYNRIKERLLRGDTLEEPRAPSLPPPEPPALERHEQRHRLSALRRELGLDEDDETAAERR